jgi:signal transduction histidine kinase
MMPAPMMPAPLTTEIRIIVSADDAGAIDDRDRIMVSADDAGTIDDRDRIMVSADDAVDFWQFSIADNGPGIDAKEHDRIFQIFQTLHPRDESENTGVGLSIVKKIIERQGGRIWGES